MSKLWFPAYVGLLLAVALWRWETQWWVVLLRYAPPVLYLLPLIGILAGFAITRKPVPKLGLALAVAAFLWFSGLCLNLPREGRLKVLSFNMHANYEGMQLDGYDLVFLQEARQPIQHEGYFSAHAGDLVILSRFPILSQRPLEDVCGFRPALEAVVDIEGQAVQLVNVHYVTGDTGKSLARSSNRREYLVKTAAIRKTQTERLLSFLGEGPAIVTGDFNTPPHSLELPLQDAFARGGLGWGLTYGNLWRIDYIWASQHFRVRGCHTLQPWESDHRGVLAQLDWK